MANFEDYSVEILEAARRFFQIHEELGSPADIREAASKADVPWSTAWKWTTIVRPQYVANGFDWPFDNPVYYMSSDPDLTASDNNDDDLGDAPSEPYTYSESTDIYIFSMYDKPYPIPGDVVRSICRTYSNYDGTGLTVQQVANHTSMPQAAIKTVLRSLKHTHASGPRTPEELHAANSIDDLVEDDLETKKQKYDVVFQTEDLRQLKKDAEAHRRGEFVHQRRMEEWGGRIEEILKTYQPPSVIINKADIVGQHLLDLSLSDLHFGKLAEHDISGAGDYNREIAVRRASTGIEKILNRASVFGVDKILFELGNDLFHVDNQRNGTSAGTPQDVDGMAIGHFDQVATFTMKHIDMLLQVAPVDILGVPGNHDEERAHYLSVLLKHVYANHPHVYIDATPQPRKYYQYGATLLGKAHGKGPKDKDLPRIMAVEVPQMWGQTRFREFHVGHLHMREHTEFTVQNEFTGVRVRRKPSLSGTDFWHAKNGYVGSIHAAEGYLYHKEEGFAGTVHVIVD